jgi:hypothetical protein
MKFLRSIKGKQKGGQNEVFGKIYSLWMLKNVEM